MGMTPGGQVPVGGPILANLSQVEGAVDHVVVVAGGPGATPPVDAACLPVGARVIAADSGLDHARRLGLTVELVVGDLDSVTPAALAAAEAEGTRVERHPVAKDQTDLELALDHAIGHSPGEVTVIATAGGRLDHLLAVVSVIAAPAYAAATMHAWIGGTFTAVVRPGQPASLVGPVGSLVTLLPWAGPALGVSTRGLAYPLTGEDLMLGTSRGVSNELA